MKNSLASLHHYVTYMSAAIALMFCYSASVFAKNNCDASASLINPLLHAQSGIGGTGAPLTESGVGGTGVHDGGMGGTGVSKGGIGGTGAPLADSGIGGTGAQEGGIGGSGYVADDGGIGGTGIIGVITGFASVCVSGIEVHYNSDTSVSVDGRSSTARDLAVGQIAAVRALGTGHELVAKNITVMHAAIGPISNFNSETGEMRVLDQAVHIGKSTDLSHVSNLKTGDWVQVSGHRLSDGAIVASRIETTPPQAQAKINGHVTQIDEQGFVVNGTRVQHDEKSLPAGISKGVEIQITGQWDGTHLNAQDIQIEPMLRSIGNVEHLVIEGYIHALGDKELNVGNRIVTIDSDTQLEAAQNDLQLNQRVLINGRLGADQRINSERIEIRNLPPVQIQDRNDRFFNDNSDKDRRNNSDNESESATRSDKNNPERSGHGDSGSSQGNLRKELDHSSGKSQPSDRDFRGEERGKGDDKRLDHSNSSGRDHVEKSSDIRNQSTSDHKIDKPENPRESDSDSRDRPDGYKDNARDTDVQDRARDHERHEKHLIIDRHERPNEFDSSAQDRIGDHRESIRDIDIPDRTRD
ncbi:MAG: DUF5666 domain-containing protein [Nitrosomonas ureae]